MIRIIINTNKSREGQGRKNIPLAPIIFLFLLYIIRPIVVQASIDTFLVESAHYTAAQSQTIISLVERLEKNGLPEEYLQNKIREAVVKKVSFDKLLAALMKLEHNLDRANEIIDTAARKGVHPRNYSYCVRALTEDLEADLTDKELDEFLRLIANSGSSFEYFLRAIEMYVSFKDLGLSANEAKEVVRLLIERETAPKKMRMLLRIFKRARYLNVPVQQAKEEFLELAATNENINRAIRQLQRKYGFTNKKHRRGGWK